MQAIETKDAPLAIGTYSQAIKAGNLVFVSGQIPLNPETMQIVSDNIKEQVVQVFENLTAIAKAVNKDLKHFVKLTIYLTDLKNFAIVNEVMAKYFSSPYPARATVEISKLPKDVKIEIDGIIAIDAN